jgi:CubicO group peptidase (beta-lactamase class C family)
LTPATVSESGSVAKQFVAAAVALLAQQGRLSLDDPVRKYLPEVPDFGEPVTIRQLMNHTSGLRDIHGLFGLLGKPSYSSHHTNKEVLQLVARQQRLNFTPGSEYSYSNTGYVLLTFIVERISGKPFDVFCREDIFQPLGMTNTQWRSDFTRVVKDRATAYGADSTGAFKINMPYSDLYGNGGLLTTVGDLLIWNESFESGTPKWRELTKLLETPSKLNSGRAIT